MATTICIWLDDDRITIHHTDDEPDLRVGGATGSTRCGRTGLRRLVHHDNLDMGRPCPECAAACPPDRPALEGSRPAS